MSPNRRKWGLFMSLARRGVQTLVIDVELLGVGRLPNRLGTHRERATRTEAAIGRHFTTSVRGRGWYRFDDSGHSCPRFIRGTRYGECA